MKDRTLALVGDYSEAVTAHRAIPKALELAGRAVGVRVSWEWVATRNLKRVPRDLSGFAGVWVVPASPYENAQGAIDAIRWAREARLPCFGTCGGFQHMLLEFARDVAGIRDAEHEETNPGASTLLLSRLSCPLVEKPSEVRFDADSVIGEAYGAPGASEGYHCNFGLNATYRPALESAGLRFTCWDGAGEVRGAELPSHPFFVGVLFQPERAALEGRTPPLVAALVGSLV